jgi:hypothetical protein
LLRTTLGFTGEQRVHVSRNEHIHTITEHTLSTTNHSRQDVVDELGEIQTQILELVE